MEILLKYEHFRKNIQIDVWPQFIDWNWHLYNHLKNFLFIRKNAKYFLLFRFWRFITYILVDFFQEKLFWQYEFINLCYWIPLNWALFWESLEIKGCQSPKRLNYIQINRIGKHYCTSNVLQAHFLEIKYNCTSDTINISIKYLFSDYRSYKNQV